jgi:hypothetical protein
MGTTPSTAGQDSRGRADGPTEFWTRTAKGVEQVAAYILLKTWKFPAVALIGDLFPKRACVVLQRSTVLPAHGETLGMRWPPRIDVAAQRANRFPDAAKDESLARWADGLRARCSRPQGGALGWKIGGLSARKNREAVS